MNSNFRNIGIVFIIGTLIFVIGSAFYNDFSFDSFNEFIIHFSFYQLYAFVLGYSNLYFFKYLEKQTWDQNKPIKRVAIGLAGSTLITLVGLFFLRVITAVWYNGRSFDEYWATESIQSYYFGIWISMTVVITFHVIYF